MQDALLQSIRMFLRTGLVVSVWCGVVLAFYLSLGPRGLGWSEANTWLGAFLLACGCSWLGWAVRQAWLYPRRLRKAEALWAAGGFASDVIDSLSDVYLATGELGYRIWLLRAKANHALGYRNLAWFESEAAHLSRVPFWLRPFLRRYLRSIPGRSRASLDHSCRIWLRLASDMPSLEWLVALHDLREQPSDGQSGAWGLFMAAMVHAADDPVLLEDMMLVLLRRLQEKDLGASTLGPQSGEPEVQAAFERVIALLLHRHGHLRTGWDRVPPALYLLQKRRYAEILALGLSLPAGLCPENLWVARIAAHKGLGDLEGAWQATGEAVGTQPDSFRLWMMREDLALELDRNAEALEALERAGAFFKDGGPLAQLREWHTRRAEYAYWVENDSGAAAQHLDFLPQDPDQEGRPPLRLLILLDLGRYDEVHAEVGPLLAVRPGNPELRLLQAESLAGMQAWDSLQEQLASMEESAGTRPAFWHLRGICRAHLGDPVHAREDLERSVQMEPDNLGFLLDAGHASAELGDWERAEFHWRRALGQDDRNEEVLIQLAEARRTLHDLDGAKRFLRECLLHHPESSSAQVMLAELDAN